MCLAARRRLNGCRIQFNLDEGACVATGRSRGRYVPCVYASHVPRVLILHSRPVERGHPGLRLVVVGFEALGGDEPAATLAFAGGGIDGGSAELLQLIPWGTADAALRRSYYAEATLRGRGTVGRVGVGDAG